MRSIDPVLRDVVRRFPRRGSLTTEDLYQTAALGVVRYVDRFDPLRGEFAAHAYQAAFRAVEEFVQRQSADVSVSHWARKGRGRSVEKGSLVTVRVVPRESKTASGNGADTTARLGLVESRSESRAEIDEAKHTPTAEDLLGTAQEVAGLREALRALPRSQADLLRRVHGIGCEAESVRSLAIKLGRSRSSLDAALHVAEDALRKQLHRRRVR